VADRVRAALEQWERWIAELERHPLDRFEYEAALGAREDLHDLLEIAGDEELWKEADVVDARFVDLTTENPGAAGAASDEGWWWRRVPADPGYRRYMCSES
jgi:hypothetical protein